MKRQFRRILVTGGAGFIGVNFVRTLLRQRPDAQVVNLDKLTYAGNLESLGPNVLDDPRHEFVRGDVCDPDVVAAAVAGCDAVVNLAAESHVDRSLEDARPFVRTNVEGVLILLEAARKAGVTRFLQVGTDEVYGSLSLENAQETFSEDRALDPRSPYSASKAAADHLTLAAGHSWGLDAIVTRCGNNFGPWQFPEKIIPLFILNLLAGKPVPLYGDGLYVRDWIHVEDHCLALLAVLERGRAGEIYNIGADNQRSNLELTQLLLDLTGRDASLIRHVEDRPGHDRRYAVDTRKIRGELGWRPLHSKWPEALAATVDWYRANPEWAAHVLSGEYRAFYERQYGRRLAERPAGESC